MTYLYIVYYISLTPLSGYIHNAGANRSAPLGKCGRKYSSGSSPRGQGANLFYQNLNLKNILHIVFGKCGRKYSSGSSPRGRGGSFIYYISNLNLNNIYSLLILIQIKIKYYVIIFSFILKYRQAVIVLFKSVYLQMYCDELPLVLKYVSYI